jgi:hypothetical protein
MEKQGASPVLRAGAGLFAPIFWLRQKDFRFNPWRPTGFSRFARPDFF